MLDSNLPTYYFKPSPDKNRPYESSLLFTQFDSEPEPRYNLVHPDPSTPTARNCYAAALFDAYIPDVLFGEVLVKPEWTQPTLSQEEIRKNGGVPPKPQPVIPNDFAVQLYNPDQQIVVTEKPGSWGGTSTYHFSMPQHTFRTPSASALDRGSDDPGADPSTPQINFIWKREGRKELSCFLTGKSTDKGKKKKGGKEPDIAVAIFTGMKDLTIYEPNLHRVEMEDYKGLEVVLLLSATVIRDIYSGQKKDCFNVGEAPRKNSSGGMMRRKSSSPMLLLNGNAPPPPARPLAPGQLQANGLPIRQPQQRRQSMPFQPNTYSGPPPPDPRAQWEIEAETARLRQQADAEKRMAEARRREQMKRDEEEAKRVKKMLDAEDKERRRQQVEIDKETQRLRKKYGDQSNLIPPRPHPQQRQSFQPYGSGSQQRPPMQPLRPVQAPPRPQTRPTAGPYLQPNGLYAQPPAASTSSFFHGSAQPKPPKPKRSFFGLRTMSEETAPSNNRLSKQRSTMF